jgi:hypothetical protein
MQEAGDRLVACQFQANLRCLSVGGTLLKRLPEGLCALQDLSIAGCSALAEDWLPLCSAAMVHTLRADNSNLTRLPQGLTALTLFIYSGKRHLPEEISALCR